MPTLLERVNDSLELLLVVALLGTGLWLTLRLGFIQVRRFGHGLAVVSGRYDDPDAPGEVSHSQALTTALSATIGIGNIAGVAIAIHWGGPGAVFWMWVTAFLGMATKFTEVTLAQKYRVRETGGEVSGGPMYYIERGLGPRWRPLARFFAGALIVMALVSGNAIQANTLADLASTSFGVTPWLVGLLSAGVVGAVIVGGIGRIGRVTSVLAPAMAALYVLGGLAVVALNAEAILPSLRAIVTEAFNPTAGVAGAGAGVFLQTMLWGVRRGLFSNEAGQGSAPIAHSAARTDAPVSEGVVALLEPFIDTLVICTITALAILCTGVWRDTTPTAIALGDGELAHVLVRETGTVDNPRPPRHLPNHRRLLRRRRPPRLARGRPGARVRRRRFRENLLRVARPGQRSRRNDGRAAARTGLRPGRRERRPADPLGLRARPRALRRLPCAYLRAAVRGIDGDLVELLRRSLRGVPLRPPRGAALPDHVRRNALPRRDPVAERGVGARRSGHGPRDASERGGARAAERRGGGGGTGVFRRVTMSSTTPTQRILV